MSDLPFANEERVILNVGGIKYETFVSTLLKYPDSLLGTMFNERNRQLAKPDAKNEYFFDRNGQIFTVVLDFYRSGRLIVPSHISLDCIKIEFDFWQLEFPQSSSDLNSSDDSETSSSDDIDFTSAPIPSQSHSHSQGPSTISQFPPDYTDSLLALPFGILPKRKQLRKAYTTLAKTYKKEIDKFIHLLASQVIKGIQLGSLYSVRIDFYDLNRDSLKLVLPKPPVLPSAGTSGSPSNSFTVGSPSTSHPIGIGASTVPVFGGSGNVLGSSPNSSSPNANINISTSLGGMSIQSSERLERNPCSGMTRLCFDQCSTVEGQTATAELLTTRLREVLGNPRIQVDLSEPEKIINFRSVKSIVIRNVLL